MTSKESLAWQWSYREQFVWFDKCDAAWIKQSTKGWEDPTERIDFLNAYGLRRGKSGKFLRRLAKDDDMWEELDRIYKKPVIEGDTSTITKRWHEAIERVRKCAKPNGEEQVEAGFNCPSFTLKLYWFYQPDALTMYDTNTVRALGGAKKVMGIRSVSEKNFLEAFENCYKQHESLIKGLRDTQSPRRYPYPRRTLDFWLWLQGLKNDKRDLTLKRFRDFIEFGVSGISK